MTSHTKMGKADDTRFVRFINAAFAKVAVLLCDHPWIFIVATTVLTLGLSAKIPFTEMHNDISDFTPFGARSRKELSIYKEFFSNRGEPKGIYAFISSKTDQDMLSVPHLNHTVEVLNKINSKFFLKTREGAKPFQDYCNGFCLLNEPVRHFYSGMSIYGQNSTDSKHIDLSYPVTTVLGTKLYMDPNFFGVDVAVVDDAVGRRVVSAADSRALSDPKRHVENNIRRLELIVLQFRSEIGSEVNSSDLRDYEMEIIDYFENEFSSPYINVYILTDSYITEEIVRAGLTLLPFLVVGFTIMMIFSSITFTISAKYLEQMSFTKVLLAVLACVCPFMACGATLGAMFLMGFRFGSILCVTPFLVLAIGVDDAYLMVNAWQAITTRRRRQGFSNVDDELKHRMVEMMVETGPSITITTITNVFAFGIGATTPAAEIQLFSIGNGLAVVFDLIFQVTLYAAFMAVFGKYELQRELDHPVVAAPKLEKKQKQSFTECYCAIVTNKWVCSSVIAMLAVYWYVSVVGAMNIKAELTPQKLFLEDSNIVKIFQQRKDYIIPYYSSCWILVENPGDINDSEHRKKLELMMQAFEQLPSSNGRYSTKLWLRDYEDFLKQSEDVDGSDEDMASGKDIEQFLIWPEFSFWSGFIQFDEARTVKRFMATTAFHGTQLVDWSNRAKLLNEWRAVADQFPQFNVSVYEEDAKFLDLIETIPSVAMQSSFYTFVCMFFVAALFIGHRSTLLVATFSILSTSVGVFGIMSWWGADLDPLLMSAMVMSIGFSVDIPSHISYHFYKTGQHTDDISRRLQKTINAVGFPVFEASVSTSLCVMSLFVVNLNMAQIFAKCMLLVVVLGTVHGLLVMPVIFTLISSFPLKSKVLPQTSTEMA